MGWGFRKSIRIAPGVRVNVGRRSTGISLGPRGLKLSANSRGRRGVYAGWRGLFFRKKL
jgi:hypothetical protein